MIYRTRKRLTVDRVLICLSMNPYRHLIRRWNWKSACLSALLRGILVFGANLSAGGSSAAGAMLAEIFYRALTSGFYSALTQSFRFAQPVWAASGIPVILIPIVSDGCELAMHGMRGTQHLGATAAASMIFTAVSTSFELFAMRNNVLVMGENSRPLMQDLKSLPNLVVIFANQTSRRLLSTITSVGGRKQSDRQAKAQALSALRHCKPISVVEKPLE